MRRVFFYLVVIVAVSAAANAYDWNTNPGDGTPENPYQISEPNHLMAIGSNAELLDKHFILTNDIIFDPNNNPAHVFDNALIAPDTDPNTYGLQGTKFSGIFNGNGFTISNLVIDQPNQDYLGMFSYTEGAIIKNLNLENINISGQEYVGGLVGFNYGVISDITVSGIINANSEVGGIIGTSYGGVIRDCRSNVFVNVSNWFCGGICGYQCDTPMINCHATGDVIGTVDSGDLGGLVGGARWSKIINCSASGTVVGEERIGGLVGWSDWYLLKSCYATGNVQANYYAGGLVGDMTGTIENCYASGDVFSNYGAGGLIGADWGGYGHVMSSVSTGTVSGTEKVAGYVGESSGYTLFMGGNFFDAEKNPGLPAFGDRVDPNIAGMTTAELFDDQTYLSSGWDFTEESVNGTEDYWMMPADDGYPFLAFQVSSQPPLPSFSGGDGSVENPFLIASVSEFSRIGDNFHLIDKHFRLVNDLDFSGLEFIPIGTYDLPFTGTFDGNKKRILNVELNADTEEEYLGVFGSLECGARIYDLGVENLIVDSSSSTDIGGIAGDSYNAVIQRCYVTGRIVNWGYNGFIAANMKYGAIENCHALGYISCGRAGGIASRTNSTVLVHSYASVLIDNAVSAGNVIAYGSADFQNCYYDGTKNEIIKANGLSEFAGAASLGQSQICDSNVYIDAGWDFVGEQTNGTEDIWRISSSGPVFEWQRDTIMPNVIGMDIANAENTIAQSGLGIIISKEVYSETVPSGHILEQIPAAGTPCVESSPVSLFVSKGSCPYSGGGSGTPENPCQIANVNDFLLLSNTGQDYQLHFILLNDLDLSAFTYEGGIFDEFETSLLPFTGVFDGSGYTISNININLSDSTAIDHGIFRRVGCKGKIKNLSVTGVHISGVNYKMAGGGIVGVLTLGAIENCRVFGNNSPGGIDFGGIVSKNSNGIIQNCIVETNLTGNYDLAGLALNNSGIISQCYANVNLTATSGGSVAGLVSNNTGYIDNCYARGNLTGKYYGGGIAAWSTVNNRITNSYAACTLTGYFYDSSVGGLVGYEGSYPLSYPGCIWNKTLYPNKGTAQQSSSVLGATSEEMKFSDTYTTRGWDFVGESANGDNDFWRMCVDGVDYPRLSWEFAKDGDFACADGVDLGDLEALAERWLLSEATTPAAFSTACDANGDGVVDLADFAVLSENWPSGLTIVE